MTLNINTILKIWGTLILTTIITIICDVRNDFEYNYHILKIWATLILTTIITVTRECQYNLEYNYDTQKMENVDDKYN